MLTIPYCSIGKSVSGRDLYVFRLGNGKKQIFLNGAHHGTEWLTAPCLMRFAFEISEARQKEKRLAGFNIKTLLANTTIHILPMANPDGIEIARLNPEKLWQSNARGVDLNHNYNAGFTTYKVLEKQHNITAGNTRYSGKFPESEPEVQAICKYVRENPMDLCVALHSQGEVIYYEYENFTPPCSKAICKELARISGYLPDHTLGFASYGGFKDWFIKEFGKPAFTVEIGSGKNPLPGYQFESIYQKVLPLLLTASFLG